MKQLFKHLEGLVSHLKEYADIRFEEVRLEIADRTSKVVAAIVVRAILFVVIAFIVFFASLSAGYALGVFWGRLWLGFLAVSGFYVIIAIMIWITRERTIRIPMINTLLHQMTKKENDDDDA